VAWVPMYPDVKSGYPDLASGSIGTHAHPVSNLAGNCPVRKAARLGEQTLAQE